ncbi:hypothetical protein A3G69_05220 [Candidatus Peribacteria bacterium RIFCSPLOWO2_12_FULL_53_10]|nr:MAG: hypothetical protein A3G69_05220 [Candidatus Peribacteria bacterium RIFCSPLOWO2_12_FULL_53_10]
MHNSRSLAKKVLLLINPGFRNKEFILKRMKELGVIVVTVHDKKLDWAQPYVDHWVIVEKQDPEQMIMEKIDHFLKEHAEITIDGAITFWEEEIPLLAKICEKFGWIGNSVDAALNTRSKFGMQDVLRQHGRPAIRQHLLESESDLKEAMEHVGFPAVIKPLFGSDSHFVMYTDGAERARDAYAEAISKYDHPYALLQKYPKGLFVYQEFIDGTEFSVECFCQNGIPYVAGIHEKTGMNMPFFLETGDFCPPHISEEQKRALTDEAKATLIALGVRESLAHVEIKLTKRGPQVIEVASRMGGSDIFKNILQVYDFDLIKTGCEIALGIKVTDTPLASPKAHIRSFVFIPKVSGVIATMRGFEDLTNNESVNAYYLSKKIGDTILVPPAGYERIGWVSVRGKNAQDTEKKMQDIQNKVHYEIIPME